MKERKKELPKEHLSASEVKVRGKPYPTAEERTRMYVPVPGHVPAGRKFQLEDRRFSHCSRHSDGDLD